ncbi:hypothetical protein HispidOSU_028681, partial [Sigmodon hispidus]
SSTLCCATSHSRRSTQYAMICTSIARAAPPTSWRSSKSWAFCPSLRPHAGSSPRGTPSTFATLCSTAVPTRCLARRSWWPAWHWAWSSVSSASACTRSAT